MNEKIFQLRYIARPLVAWLVIGLLASTLSACAMFGKDSAADAPAPIDRFSDDASDQNVTLELYAGKNMNPDNAGNPLALLVKLYVLKDINTFEQADFDTFLSADDVRDALGSDLVKERETMLVPGQKYTTHVPLMPEGGYLGVVALFRNPAADRWRMAFKLAPDEAKPVTIGLNACAMSMTRGAIVNAGNRSLARLTNAACPEQIKKEDAYGSAR